MSEILEKVDVRCALNQGPEYLERFFAVSDSAGGGTLRLPLRASLQIGGMTVNPAKPVVFTLSKLHVGTNMIPTSTLHWEPCDGGPFPSFDGTVSIEASDDYDSCALVLRGGYIPPLGAAGAAFDAVMGRKIASATARDLLQRIRDFIEAAYERTERAKTHSAL